MRWRGSIALGTVTGESLSGGPALERYEHVETIGFDYGQRHRVELASAQAGTVRITLALESRTS